MVFLHCQGVPFSVSAKRARGLVSPRIQFNTDRAPTERRRSADRARTERGQSANDSQDLAKTILIGTPILELESGMSVVFGGAWSRPCLPPVLAAKSAPCLNRVPSAHISVHVKRKTRAGAQYRFQYVDPGSGRRCLSRDDLQTDHVCRLHLAVQTRMAICACSALNITGLLRGRWDLVDHGLIRHSPILRVGR